MKRFLEDIFIRIYALTENRAKGKVIAAFALAELEGIIPALETAHALAALGRIRLRGDEMVIVNLSGRGDKDMETYTRLKANEQD